MGGKSSKQASESGATGEDNRSAICIHAPVDLTDWHQAAAVRSLIVNDTSFFTGSADQTVKHWEMSTGECIWEFEGHTGSVNCLVRTRTEIITGSADGTTLSAYMCACIEFTASVSVPISLHISVCHGVCFCAYLCAYLCPDISLSQLEYTPVRDGAPVGTQCTALPCSGMTRVWRTTHWLLLDLSHPLDLSFCVLCAPLTALCAFLLRFCASPAVSLWHCAQAPCESGISKQGTAYILSILAVR